MNDNAPNNTDQLARIKRIWNVCRDKFLAEFRASDFVKELGESSICIDCGANIGNVAEILLETGATVYAFEPNPMAFAKLTERFSGKHRMHCIPKGVFSVDTTMKLYMHEYSADDEIFWSEGSSFFASKDNILIDNYIEAPLIDLPRFIVELDRNVDILKLDVEGAEYAILDSLISRGLHKKIKHILVETHDQTIPEIRQLAEKVREKIKEENITNIHLDWL